MKLVRKYLSYPHLILSVILMGIAVGTVSFQKLPLNLFPDSNYPAVSVLIIWPGASAQDVEARITRQIDTELASIDRSRKIKAITRDEVAAITVEFEYEKGINAAVTDVRSALDRVMASLPGGIMAPRIFKITDATTPVATLAVYPKEGSILDMSRVRQISDNELKESLLRLPDVAGVEVFGGYRPEIRISIDADRARAYNLDIAEIASAISIQNRNIPGGTIIRDNDQFLIKIEGEKLFHGDLLNIVIKKEDTGEIHLRDIATVSVDREDKFSFFHGNGKPAIALNVLRSETGHVTGTLESLNRALPGLKREFENLEIEIADTTGDIIEASISNMISALRDAIILTVFVIFLFLAKPRTTLLTAISIPFTFILTFAGMRLIGLELNIVTMTGIILAVGLLVDDSIVVIENIDRYMRIPDKKPKDAAVEGTEDIFLADFSGTVTTLVVLIPVMFVSGYTQKILRPLSITLSLALFFSFLVSVTVIPLFAPYLQGGTRIENIAEQWIFKISEKILEPLRRMFVWLFGAAEHRRLLIIAGGLILLVVSMRQMPLAGRDLMPPMDTGIVKINFEADPGASAVVTEKAVYEMEKKIREIPGFVRMATVAGSESGVISFGAERTPQEGSITAHFVDRFKRDQTIWEIRNMLRQDFSKIPELKTFQIFEFGATPFSSISAPIDVQISGRDPEVLDKLANEVADRLYSVRGLTDITRSWEMNKKEWILVLNHEQLTRYEITPVKVSEVLNAVTQGLAASVMRVPNQIGYAITVRLQESDKLHVDDLSTLTVATPFGPVSIETLGHFEQQWERTRFVREDLRNVVNVRGFRSRMAISHIQDQVNRSLAGLELPHGYEIHQKGEISTMKESFSSLGRAILLSVILVYFCMVPAFKSFLHPLTVMVAIPLSFIGVSWAMLLANRHFSMPASMGMILLSGIVVNNSILLLDFIRKGREEGLNRSDAILNAIRTRTRPIIMTATSTMVGMLPIALERAVGLERLSPLAVVVTGGLFVSTFLTLLYVPVFYTIFDDMGRFFARMAGKHDTA